MADPVKRLLLLRHSFKGKGNFKNVISPEGMEYARRVGAQLGGRGITGVFASSMMRTCQTAIALLEGAGDCTCVASPKVMNLMGQPVEEWAKRYPAGNESLEEMERIDPDFIRSIGLLLHVVMMQIIEETPEGGTSLVVGHTPCLEIAIRAITQSEATIKPLAELEGVVLAIMEDGTIIVEEEIRWAA